MEKKEVATQSFSSQALDFGGVNVRKRHDRGESTRFFRGAGGGSHGRTCRSRTCAAGPSDAGRCRVGPTQCLLAPAARAVGPAVSRVSRPLPLIASRPSRLVLRSTEERNTATAVVCSEMTSRKRTRIVQMA